MSSTRLLKPTLRGMQQNGLFYILVKPTPITAGHIIKWDNRIAPFGDRYACHIQHANFVSC